MDLADAALIANQAVVTGAGLWDLYQGYKHIRGTSAPHMSGIPVVSTASRRERQQLARSRRNLRGKSRVLFPPISSRKSSAPYRTNMVTPQSTQAPAHRMSVDPRRTAYHRTLGRRKGKYSTRRAAVLSQTDAVPRDKQLFANGMIFIPAATGTEDATISKRRGELAYVHGVKWRIIFKYNQAAELSAVSYSFPIRVRWAVLVPKGDSIPAGEQTLTDFFIDPNPDTNQVQNGPSGTGNHFDLFHRKINREAYSVLREGQVLLSQQGAPDNMAAVFPPTSMKTISTYVPVKRQVRFNSDGTPEKDMTFVWWYARDCDTTTPAYWAVERPITVFHEKITYFTNAAMYR